MVFSERSRNAFADIIYISAVPSGSARPGGGVRCSEVFVVPGTLSLSCWAASGTSRRAGRSERLGSAGRLASVGWVGGGVLAWSISVWGGSGPLAA